MALEPIIQVEDWQWHELRKYLDWQFPSVSEDVKADAIAHTFVSLHKYNPQKGPLMPWLRMTGHAGIGNSRKAEEAERRGKRVTESIDRSLGDIESETGEMHEMIPGPAQSHQVVEWVDILKELTELQQQAVVYLAAGYTAQEAGELMDTPAANVRAYASRGRVRMKKILSGESYDSRRGTLD